jgi:aerotaxis receptor
VLLPLEQLIVTKTDLQGRLTYANRLFLDVSGYDEAELLGAPHNCVRHPDMPRGLFRYLWERLAQGEEVFAWVKNLTAQGAFYWVFAHITPSRDAQGQVTGYHSSRRAAPPAGRALVEPVYEQMRALEAGLAPQEGAARSCAWLGEELHRRQQTWHAFVFEGWSES